MFSWFISLLLMNVTNNYEVYDLCLIVHESIIYDVSPDFFPVFYSLITGKGDCYNKAALFCFILKLKGFDCRVLFLDKNKDGSVEHAVALIMDASLGCYTMDLTNMDYKNCSYYTSYFGTE